MKKYEAFTKLSDDLALLFSDSEVEQLLNYISHLNFDEIDRLHTLLAYIFEPADEKRESDIAEIMELLGTARMSEALIEGVIKTVEQQGERHREQVVSFSLIEYAEGVQLADVVAQIMEDRYGMTFSIKVRGGKQLQIMTIQPGILPSEIRNPEALFINALEIGKSTLRDLRNSNKNKEVNLQNSWVLEIVKLAMSDSIKGKLEQHSI